MLTKEGNIKLLKTILSLTFQNKAFAKCPKCSKTLGMFEIYNENCSYCGKIDFGDMVIVKGIEDENSEEQFEEYEEK